MRAAILVLALGSTAHAETFQSRDIWGIDISTLWEPRNRDAFGAGPVIRWETAANTMPEWLDFVTSVGIFVDSADRSTAALDFGLMVRGDGPLYATIKGGGTYANAYVMGETIERLDWSASGALGLRLGNWDVRATALTGGLFDGPVWLFSLGRNLFRVDTTTTSSWL